MSVMKFVDNRPVPVPDSWIVRCSNCEGWISCEMDEASDGSFFVSDQFGDPCVRCEPCGVFFIPAPVVIKSGLP